MVQFFLPILGRCFYCPLTTVCLGFHFVSQFMSIETPRIFGLQARFYSVDGFNKFYFGYKDKNKMETCVEAGCKSEHYDLAFGKENKDSTFKCPKTKEVFFGKGNIPAKTMYIIEMRKRADELAQQETKAALATNVTEA